jgi:hypothetical protein
VGQTALGMRASLDGNPIRGTANMSFEIYKREAGMTAKRILLLGLICGCVTTAAGWAATLRAMKLADLTHGADIIFVGTAVSSVSDWNADRTRIYTRTTFQVKETLKGHAGQTIAIQTLGGGVGGIGMRVSGIPVFRAREKHLLFVKNGRVTGTHRVLGWAQGDFRVHKDRRSGRETVSRDLGGVNLVGGNAPSSTNDLAELKDAIRRLKGR